MIGPVSSENHDIDSRVGPIRQDTPISTQPINTSGSGRTCQLMDYNYSSNNSYTEYVLHVSVGNDKEFIFNIIIFSYIDVMNLFHEHKLEQRNSITDRLSFVLKKLLSESVLDSKKM